MVFLKMVKKGFLILLAIAFFAYLGMPSPDFPPPPPDAIQSDEPGDTESPLRRAYFTNLSRSAVLAHYTNQLSISWFFPTYRLNYPPEDAQTLIRDQTRSTYLEEVVHPLRESVYINGFEPIEKKDTIDIGGRIWRQKIIVRYVPSNNLTRLVVGLATVFVGYMTWSLWSRYLHRFIKKH